MPQSLRCAGGSRRQCPPQGHARCPLARRGLSIPQESGCKHVCVGGGGWGGGMPRLLCLKSTCSNIITLMMSL